MSPPIFFAPPPTLPPAESPSEAGPVVQSPSVAPPAEDPPPESAPVEDATLAPEAPPASGTSSILEAPQVPPIQPVAPPVVGEPAPGSQSPGFEDAPSPADKLLRPGTRPVSLGVNVGRAFLLDSSDVPYSSYYALLGPVLVLEENAGFFFRRGSNAGVQLEAVFQQAFIASFGDDIEHREFGFAARVAPNLQASENHGIYFVPSVQAGFNLLKTSEGTYDYYSGPSNETDTATRFDLQFGLAARILLGDRAYFNFRPVDLQVVTDFKEHLLRWRVFAGLGFMLGRPRE